MPNQEIKNPTLAEVKAKVDKYFEGNHAYTQRQYDQYTIAALSEKVIELERIIQNRTK